MRNYLIAGNWKMNQLAGDTRDFFKQLSEKLKQAPKGVELLICPPFTSLQAAVESSKPIKGMHIGAQNMHQETSGAFTGEVTAAMIRETGATHVIIGHSERRQYYNETDESVNQKIKAAISAGVIPVVCVGEQLDERKKNIHFDVVTSQVKGAYSGISSADAAKTVIAYEPVWAIGTGETATPDQAQEMHLTIRKQVSALYGSETAASIRILYGGSMKPDNADELLGCPDVDGGLIGGASLKPDSFLAIAESAANQ